MVTCSNKEVNILLLLNPFLLLKTEWTLEKMNVWNVVPNIIALPMIWQRILLWNHTLESPWCPSYVTSHKSLTFPWLLRKWVTWAKYALWQTHSKYRVQHICNLLKYKGYWQRREKCHRKITCFIGVKSNISASIPRNATSFVQPW